MFWIQTHEFVISFQIDEPSEIDSYIELKWHKNTKGKKNVKTLLYSLCSERYKYISKKKKWNKVQ